MPLNPKCPGYELWNKHYNEKAPANVKAYVENFKEAMKDYLEKRPEASF